MVAMSAKITKQTKTRDYLYWVLFRFSKKIGDTGQLAGAYASIEDEGWVFLTVPALIVSQEQLRFYQKQIAEDGKFDGVIIRDFKLVITR